MEKNTDSSSERVSFWKTLPGILTALATLVTAAAGLLGALNQIKPASQPIPLTTTSSVSPQAPEAPSGSKLAPPKTLAPSQPAKTSSEGLSATASDVTYTILPGLPGSFYRPPSNGEYRLGLSVRISVRPPSKGVNFTEALFRLRVGGDERAPIVPAGDLKPPTEGGKYDERILNESKTRKIEFDVPDNENIESLIVNDEAGASAAIPLSRDVLSRRQ